MTSIKLIWDFRGLDGLATAQHHCIHLREFAEMSNLPYHKIDETKLNEIHAIAFIVIDEQYMKTFRDSLKPHRGEIASDTLYD